MKYACDASPRTSVRGRRLPTSGARLACIAVAIFTIVGCRREQRRFTETPAGAAPAALIATTDFQPGAAVIRSMGPNPYGGSAWSTSEGQRLFSQMNCAGCHANGGGAIGPALMDDEWIYGSAPEQIFASIAEGRPNGMPSWKSALTNQQIWELVAYVRSLSSLEPKGSRPGRTDHMSAGPVPQQTPVAKPRTSAVPKP